MPLFDPALNRTICQRIEQQRLFSTESLEKHSRAMRLLSVALLDFITTQVSPGSFDPAPGILPDRILCFPPAPTSTSTSTSTSVTANR